MTDDGKPMTISVDEYVKSDSDWYTKLVEDLKD